MTAIDELDAKIADAMPGDRHALRGRLRSIRQAQKAGRPFDRNLTRLTRELERSVERFTARRAGVPAVTFDGDLPIHARLEEIGATLRDNPVIVLCGETGSGKSTQLPKLCLHLGRGIGGLIGHTQPRRIAARSVAARVAEELKVPLGGPVGFKVRFADSTTPNTYIKLMTDGILLAETQGDRFLNQYDTLIIDEAHERSLNIDLLLGYLKRMLPRRPDLRVIVTSATIDVERFSDFFTIGGRPAPVISVEGRTYPVEVRYQPPRSAASETGDGNNNGEGDGEADPMQNLVGAVQDVCREGHGDVLVFLPTEREIREAARLLRSRPLPGDYGGMTSEILPLYGRLSAAEQSRVFERHPHRRIVLATNVAESSITVPNIRYVVDAGTARISRYSARSGVQRLPIEAVSKASADQRKGRCGRVGPGICVRLYEEQDYETREDYTPPEIQRTNLAAVILQLKALGLGEIEQFPFLDPPRPATIKDGYDTLYELCAIDQARELTAIGQALAKLPVDPRVGRMILAGQDEGCLKEVLIIAAILELQDPRERPVEKQQAADEAHRKFLDADSDFIAFLNLWNFIRKLKDESSRSKLRRACQKNFLSYNRVREWEDIHRQLVQLAEQAGYQPRRSNGLLEKLATPATDAGDGKGSAASRFAGADSLHRALLAGLLANLALKGETAEYTGSGGQKFFLWPGSGLISKKPKWCVAAELVETTRRYARTAARVNPAWIEPLAGHLIQKSYSGPRWDAVGGRVVADEKVTLFGLPVVPRRTANYGPIEPSIARTLFIQTGLVEGDWETPQKFFEHNRKLFAEVTELLTKTRRLDLLKGDAAHFQFYDQRLPADVYDAPTLARWVKGSGPAAATSLFMTKSDIVKDTAAPVAEGDFPDAIVLGGATLPLEYHLEPGSAEDGVTVVVPKEAVNQLRPERLGWLVPGLLEEKVAALIRSLPKQVRTAFVPVPQTAKDVLSRLRFGQGEVEPAIAAELSRIAGERITAGMFDATRLPQHLRMNLRVTDDAGATVAAGRDVAALQTQLGGAASVAFSQSAGAGDWHRDGLTDWSWGDLPVTVELQRGGVKLAGYPAVVDQQDAVGLRLLDTLPGAIRGSRAGLRRLFLLAQGRVVKSQVDHLPDLDRLLMNLATLRPPGDLRRQLAVLVADRALFPTSDDELPRTQSDWQQRSIAARGRIAVAAQDVQALLGPLSQQWQQVRLLLDDRHPPQWQAAVSDVRSQLERLFQGDFLIETPWPWLVQVPRYLTGIKQRFEKLASGGLERDRQLSATLVPRWQSFLKREEELRGAEPSAKLIQYRWMLEEYRVSLFAQSLGTAVTVSEPRLEKLWAKIRF